MSISFEHVPHPRIAKRKESGPPKTTDEHVGFNGRVALILTTVVGTMWCAYAFASAASSFSTLSRRAFMASSCACRCAWICSASWNVASASW